MIWGIVIGFAAFWLVNLLWEFTEEIMKKRNRLHTLTRWPRDPRKRLELARLDVDFVIALHRCGIDTQHDPRLLEMVNTAADQALLAQRELQGKD